MAAKGIYSLVHCFIYIYKSHTLKQQSSSVYITSMMKDAWMRKRQSKPTSTRNLKGYTWQAKVSTFQALLPNKYKIRNQMKMYDYIPSSSSTNEQQSPLTLELNEITYAKIQAYRRDPILQQ